MPIMPESAALLLATHATLRRNAIRAAWQTAAMIAVAASLWAALMP